MSPEKIKDRLRKSGFGLEVLDRYIERGRFYHNLEHLGDVIAFMEEKGTLSDDLFLAAVYHDAVYDPQKKDNEEKSAALFKKDAKAARLGTERVTAISGYILDTKTHKPRNGESRRLVEADLAVLNRPLEELIRYEEKIFREYQFLDFPVYKKERLKLLKKLNTNGRLDGLISYVENRKPFIGLFCGSFNPFHRGHYNILQKAENIFDKVIIAFGKNPDKSERVWKRPETIGNRQLCEYNGLMTDFVSSLGYDVVVIRGLRNSTDFQYEQNQYRYIQELMPGIRIVNIFCDKEFEHISSSGIRTLEEFGKHRKYLLE